MPLTLRELLDKQRAEREAREKGGDALARTVTTIEPVVQVASPTPALAPQPPKPKLGLFGSLSGGGNATQSSPQTNTQAQIGMQTAPGNQSGAQANSANGAQNHLNAGNSQGTQISPVPTPTFTVDETEQLRQNLAFLAANLDEAAILPQVLRTTVNQIRQHPELNAVLVNDDFDLIIAAAKRSTKYAQRKKEDKTETRGKRQNAKVELDQFLKDQGIEW